jgi:hypothetical protein
MKSIIQYLSIVASFVMFSGCKPPPRIEPTTPSTPTNSAPGGAALPGDKTDGAKQSNNAPNEKSAIGADKAIENGPKRLADKTHLPNAYQLTEKVVSGGLPEGEVAFKELADLGVRTVISVDGAKPDVAMAKKFNMRYVHLPHGYDGVPDDRAKELAKAVKDLPGPIYIHCHHGKHRSPAAAVVACVGVGTIKPEDAKAILKTAGTSENYRGLYQSAEETRKIDDKVLDDLKIEFREIEKIPAMAQSMIAVEHLHNNLKKFKAAGWKLLPKEPALTPAHEALLLREQFTELLRTDELKKLPEGFQKLTRDAEVAGEEFEKILLDLAKADTANTAKGDSNPDLVKKADAAFEKVTVNCASCHKSFRDVPLSEKAKHAK